MINWHPPTILGIPAQFGIVFNEEHTELVNQALYRSVEEWKTGNEPLETITKRNLITLKRDIELWDKIENETN